jgi:hypothetical protein
VNMLKKGPDLKLPDLKVPDFLLDIYYDLRERHLLPLVAILLVALVTLPIALQNDASESTSAPGGATAGASSVIPSSKLVVAKAAPGLRDYRRRLGQQMPQDPFVQKYTGGKGEDGAAVGSAGEGGTEGGGAAAESIPAEPSAPESTGGGGPDDGGSEPPSGSELTYYSFSIDVRVVPVSSTPDEKKPKPSVRRNLPALTMLPSRKTPALTFMTVTKDEKKVLMLVNDNVRALFGDGVCAVGTNTCQLLALEPGVPETVVYGAEERTYRIEILKLDLVTTDHLDKAPLGKRKPREKDPQGPG